jgi:hypothetical protein
MIRSKSDIKEIVIDLTGPDGNAYALISYACKFCKQLEIDSKPIVEEMMSGDYENLVKVFDNVFGEFVILER